MGKYSRCFAFSDRLTGGEMLHVRYARDVWLTNGWRIRIRPVVLSNFHVQSIFIRATDYFILICKVLKHFLICFNLEIERQIAMGTQNCTQQNVCVAGRWGPRGVQEVVDQSTVD